MVVSFSPRFLSISVLSFSYCSGRWRDRDAADGDDADATLPTGGVHLGVDPGDDGVGEAGTSDDGAAAPGGVHEGDRDGNDGDGDDEPPSSVTSDEWKSESDSGGTDAEIGERSGSFVGSVGTRRESTVEEEGEEEEDEDRSESRAASSEESDCLGQNDTEGERERERSWSMLHLMTFVAREFMSSKGVSRLLSLLLDPRFDLDSIRADLASMSAVNKTDALFLDPMDGLKRVEFRLPSTDAHSGHLYVMYMKDVLKAAMNQALRPRFNQRSRLWMAVKVMVFAGSLGSNT
jgi:hypothetical protein